MGALSADYDADGDADLYITCLRENILYRNDGLEQFADATARAGLVLPVWSTGAAMGDADLDGDLDLYVANYADFDSAAVRPLGTQWKAGTYLSARWACPRCRTRSTATMGLAPLPR